MIVMIISIMIINKCVVANLMNMFYIYPILNMKIIRLEINIYKRIPYIMSGYDWKCYSALSNMIKNRKRTSWKKIKINQKISIHISKIKYK